MPDFSPAHPLARRNVPYTRARASEAARCASTGIVPAAPPLFQHPASRWVVRSGQMDGSARGLSPGWLV
jgi:hypothetical protein